MELIQIKVLLLCAFAFTTDVACYGMIDSVALAQEWAPKIYLHSKEKFWPGDVEVFLKEVTLKGMGCLTRYGIPTGPLSRKCYLTTKGHPYDLLKAKNSFLYGTKPTPTQPVPAYAFVKACGSDIFVISYWIFFPFNQGKDLCKKAKKMPVLGKLLKCGLKTTTIGNHIGDWEHLSIKFQGGQPVSLFLAVHEGGVYYNYNKTANVFKKTSDLKSGVLKVPHPPKTISVENNHPILYSAEGSHAVWPAPGRFAFSKIELYEVTDETDKGIEWNTRDALKVYYYPKPGLGYTKGNRMTSAVKGLFNKSAGNKVTINFPTTTPTWWYFQGRWGNKASECVLGKHCVFFDGPKGLSIRPEDYQCY